MSKRIEFTVSLELWDRIEDARGFEPRASFVKRAVEAALAEDPIRDPATIAALRESWDSPTLTRQFTEDTPIIGAALPLGTPVEKEPSEAKGPPSSEQADPGPVGSAGNSSEPVRSAAPSRPAFRCPSPGCVYVAKSPAAKCGMHGRTVVEG